MEYIKSQEINIISRKFHYYLTNNQHELIEKNIINKYNLTLLINTKNKGIISLILQYGIITCDNEIILIIEPYLTMKRDFLNLIIYYNKDINKCINLFKKINLDLFLQKDLEFLINHKLYFLLIMLDGLFLKLDIEGTDIYNSILKKYKLMNINKYISLFTKKINDKTLQEFNNIINKKYNYIIDAGNILFSRNGLIDTHSVNDLKTVIDTYPNSLIIIHKRHLKNKYIYNIIKEQLYYATPQHINDDLFIIIAYLNTQVNIITNDTFKDHSIDDNYLRCHINDVLIKYTNEKGKFTFEPIQKHTRCIQVINNCLYIPTKYKFIEIVN